MTQHELPVNNYSHNDIIDQARQMNEEQIREREAAEQAERQPRIDAYKKHFEDKLIMKKKVTMITRFSVVAALLIMWTITLISEAPKWYEQYKIETNDESRKEIDSLRIKYYNCWLKNKPNMGTSKDVIDCDSITYPSRDTLSGPQIIQQASAKESKSEWPSSTLAPKDLFYTTSVKDWCVVSQNEESHFKKENWGILATDVACDFNKDGTWDKAIIYAPDFWNKPMDYIVRVKKDGLLWNYVELEFCKDGEDSCENTFKWVIWHVKTNLWDLASVVTWQVIGEMDLSWATTWYHSHIELWYMVDKQWTNISYSKRSQTLEKTRGLQPKYEWWTTYYFTPYNLGDVNQNDASPCIGASNKNLCDLEKQGIRTIALTRDVRDALGLEFGDKVRLEWPCAWTYQIEDEMNCRFRGKPCWYKKGWKWKYHPTWNVLRPGTDLFIKGDIPSCGWGAHSIHKA